MGSNDNQLKVWKYKDDGKINNSTSSKVLLVVLMIAIILIVVLIEISRISPANVNNKSYYIITMFIVLFLIFVFSYAGFALKRENSWNIIFLIKNNYQGSIDFPNEDIYFINLLDDNIVDSYGYRDKISRIMQWYIEGNRFVWKFFLFPMVIYGRTFYKKNCMNLMHYLRSSGIEQDIIDNYKSTGIKITDVITCTKREFKIYMKLNGYNKDKQSVNIEGFIDNCFDNVDELMLAFNRKFPKRFTIDPKTFENVPVHKKGRPELLYIGVGWTLIFGSLLTYSALYKGDNTIIKVVLCPLSFVFIFPGPAFIWAYFVDRMRNT